MEESSIFLENEINILIVEDETILALEMEQTLVNLGYEVSGIESTAQNAIKHAHQNQPNLILMDIKLRGKESGIQAAKTIWQYQKIPIIFLTSYCDDQTIKSAMLSEPYGYLTKPYRKEELKATIKTALHKHNYFFENRDSLDSKKKILRIIKLENDFSFDKGKGLLSHKDDALVLTKNELKLFEILTDYTGEAVSFEKITNYIWREPLHDIGRLRTLLYRIKNKTGTELFENVYEFGYKLKVL